METEQGQRQKQRQVTVFGASGFIGRYVVRRLAARGDVVRAAVRSPNAAGFLRPMGAVGQVVPIGAPVEDVEAVTAAIAGADQVINLVGILYEKKHATFDGVHRQGAAHIARAARAAGVRRLVHVSALGADMGTASRYARSKAAGEAAVREHFPGAVILRPGIVIGPEDDFFNRFAAMSVLSPVLPLIGGGKTRFAPVYVGDVADAILAALETGGGQGGTGGGIFELGGPQIYSFRELMVLMLSVMGRRRLLLPVPFMMAEWLGVLGSLLPKPPLTRDQVTLLRQDTIASPEVPGFAALGLSPRAIETVLPQYLGRYRRQTSPHHAA